MLMKSIPRFISVALVTSFLFSFITPSVYATDFQEYDYWTYWYVEQSTGVSAEDVKSTDAGISNGEFIASNGGGTRQDAYDWIKDKYDNATNATAKGIDYYYNAVDDIYNKSVDYAVQGYYTAENALRKTVDSAGKAVYNVSSSDFWSGFYNSMYNGDGYKTIYDEGGSKTVNGTSNGLPYSIEYIGRGSVSNQGTDILLSQQWNCYYNYQIHGDGTTSGFPLFRITYNGQTYYKYYTNDSMGKIENVVVNANNIGYYFDIIIVADSYIWKGGWDFLNGSTTPTINGGEPIPQESQVGFIYYNGNKIPVYTDPSKNPFTINPDGTVDYNGNTYPIYVAPEEISGDGWLWILDYIDKQDNTKPSQNPYGQPWNTQNDGTILGGLFSGLIQDIASLFDKISKSIADLIGKLVNIITDALKKFLTLLVGDIEGYADLFDSSPTSHFDIVEDLYDLLLQCMGVNS